MKNDKRIVMHLIATNFYGGPEKQIVEHLRRLDSQKHEAIVASFLESGKANEIIKVAERAQLSHIGIPMFGPLDFRAQWKLTNLLIREKVDLLCAHGYKSCVMGGWAGFRAGIPVVGFSRGYTTENRKVAFYEWLERQTLKRMKGVVCVSEGQRRRLADMGVHPCKSWVVPNAVAANSGCRSDSNSLREDILVRLNLPQGSKMVISAGRFSPEKGHRFLIEAIGKMGKKWRSTYFVFCGEGICQKDLEAQAQELGVFGNCRFAGFRKDLQEIIQVMDLLVLPSLTEGLPNVVLEAFACAKPVVATNVGGVPEVVENGINGYLVPPQKPDLLAEAMEKCLLSPALARKMGEAGYQKVKNEFSFEAQTQLLEGIYEEILSGGVRG